MKNGKKKQAQNTLTSSGNLDEGLNETTRLHYSDSISDPASKETLKKKK